MRVALVNPNTSPATTAAMLAIARAHAGGLAVEGLTAPFGAALIAGPEALAEAARAVEALAPDLAGFDAVIVAAFGDPGLAALRARLAVPVTGIGEAAMAEAAAGGRPFAVVTTTPGLRGAIARMAAREGHAAFLGTWVTPGEPSAVMADPEGLVRALGAACAEAVAAGARALVIGGGPLAHAAEALAGAAAVPLVAPVPAAMRRTAARLRGAP